MALAGYLSDRVKRKYIVLAGMMGSITFFTAFTIVKLPIEFMLLQILVAFSWAFVYIGISSLVADSSTWNERGEAMAGLSMTLNLSNILGPLLGGIIYGLSDYPTMILVLLPLCLLAIISSIMLKEKEHISHNIYK